MFDLERTIRIAARHAGDGRAVVAAAYNLGDHLCRSLAAEGVIGGYVAHEAPNPHDHDPRIAG
jgi:hypothetical protein